MTYNTQWLNLTVKDTFEQISSRDKQVKTKDCLTEGDYPVVDQGRNLINGFVNDETKVINLNKKPIVVFGDHTRIVKWINFNFVPGADGTKLLVPNEFLIPKFFYYQLKSIDIKDRGYGRHFKILQESNFKVAPMAEQQEIVHQLDVMLAQVEQIKARLDAIPAILKKFRQSVLADAVSGKLTEEWRGTSDLNNWNEKFLEEITYRITYGLTKRPPYVEKGIPVISAKEIRSGWVDFNVANQISESDFASLREKCKIFEGDVLFSKTGSIGHVAIYNHSRPSASSQNIAVITPKLEDVNTEYLYCYLKSPLVQNIAQQSVKANAIPDLQLGIISKFTINLPPIVEQQEIVRRINALFLYAEVIEKIVQSAQKRVNLLTQSILAKAFSGELTAEWREQHQDLIIGINSAESLLAKIQAERILDAKNTKRPITRKKKQ